MRAERGVGRVVRMVGVVVGVVRVGGMVGGGRVVLGRRVVGWRVVRGRWMVGWRVGRGRRVGWGRRVLGG